MPGSARPPLFLTAPPLIQPRRHVALNRGIDPLRPNRLVPTRTRTRRTDPLHGQAPTQPPRCAAHPPRRVGKVAKDLQQALQTSLQARTSRIAVRLPEGAKLGTERRHDGDNASKGGFGSGAGGGGGGDRRVAGDRELARVLAGMFERTGLGVRVVFATERERAAAVKMWGPLAECDCIALAGSSGGSRKTGKGKKKQREVSGSGSGSAQGSGFGKAAPAADEKVADPDVYIVVGGGAGILQAARKTADSVGMDKLVIVANANSLMESVPADLDAYFAEEFETVYHFTPNPHPQWNGGVLFRKFPDEWVLCRMTAVGILQELLQKPSKPTMTEMADALSKEGSKPGNDLLKKITDFGRGV